MAEQQATLSLFESYMKVLEEIPSFAPDAQGSNGARSYNYLKLSTLLERIRPVFAEHHIGFYQSVDFELNAPEPWRIYNQTMTGRGRYQKEAPNTSEQPLMIAAVNTYIFNSVVGDDRNRMKVGSYPVVMTGDPKANGSAVTYARRYSLFAALDIYPDPDDDGTAAQTRYVPQPAPQTTSAWQEAQRAVQTAQAQQQPSYELDSQAGGITKDEADSLWQLCKSLGVDLLTTASQIKGHKVTKLRELTKEDAQLIRSRIDQATSGDFASA